MKEETIAIFATLKTIYEKFRFFSLNKSQSLERLFKLFLNKMKICHSAYSDAVRDKNSCELSMRKIFFNFSKEMSGKVTLLTVRKFHKESYLLWKSHEKELKNLPKNSEKYS